MQVVTRLVYHLLVLPGNPIYTRLGLILIPSLLHRNVKPLILRYVDEADVRTVWVYPYKSYSDLPILEEAGRGRLLSDLVTLHRPDCSGILVVPQTSQTMEPPRKKPWLSCLTSMVSSNCQMMVEFSRVKMRRALNSPGIPRSAYRASYALAIDKRVIFPHLLTLIRPS